MLTLFNVSTIPSLFFNSCYYHSMRGWDKEALQRREEGVTNLGMWVSVDHAVS